MAIIKKIILGKVDRVKRVINSYMVDIEMTRAEVTDYLNEFQLNTKSLKLLEEI